MTLRKPRRTVEELVGLCREKGMRRTRALDGLLLILRKAERPLTLGDLHARMVGVCRCDRATVYRCLTRLERVGVVRRLGLHERAAYYTLLEPGEHHDYLICTECGTIAPLLIDCPVHQLEEEVGRRSGYVRLYHELEFFGVCPCCQLR